MQITSYSEFVKKFKEDYSHRNLIQAGWESDQITKLDKYADPNGYFDNSNKMLIPECAVIFHLIFYTIDKYSNRKSLIVIDEMMRELFYTVTDQKDLTILARECENIDFIISFRPSSGSKSEQDTCPLKLIENEQYLQTLTHIRRNSKNILKFMKWCNEKGVFHENGFSAKGLVSNKQLEVLDDNFNEPLPEGGMVHWLHISEPTKIVKGLKKAINHARTISGKDGGFSIVGPEEWFKNNPYFKSKIQDLTQKDTENFYTTSEFDGCDDDVIVYFAAGGFLQEIEITRARRHLILLTKTVPLKKKSDTKLTKEMKDNNEKNIKMLKKLCETEASKSEPFIKKIA